MSHRPKRRLSRTEQERRAREKEHHQLESVVADTAAKFTCSTEVAKDFAGQCERIAEDLETDLLFGAIAAEIWRDRPGRAQEFLSTLAALLEEHERYRQVLAALGARFAALAAHDDHEHLDPPEAYRDLIRRRIRPDLYPT